jgi:hypothetical protein
MTVDLVANDKKAGWHIVQFASGSGPVDDFVLKLRIHHGMYIGPFRAKSSGSPSTLFDTL